MLYGGTAVLFAGYAAPVSGGGGECVRRFGDRDDGHLLRSLSCIFAVSPYLMKTRNIAQNYIRDAVEIARAEYHTEAGGGDGALRPAARAAGGLCANGPVPGTGRSRST